MKRVALVTGAGSGIGRAICQSLGKNDVFVVATDISEQGVKETEALVVGTGGKCASTILDVTDSDMVRKTVADVDRIDILVNCAGWDSLMPFLETDEAFWDRIIDLNYKGALRMTHAILPGMIERQWGRIVNIASDAGRVGASKESIYSGAKGGMIAFGKTVAREVARHGITVNAVCPGITDTPLLRELIDASGGGKRVLESTTRQVPMKRLGTPEDVAVAAAFFASEGAGYITGQTLSVSGGLTMA